MMNSKLNVNHNTLFDHHDVVRENAHKGTGSGNEQQAEH